MKWQKHMQSVRYIVKSLNGINMFLMGGRDLSCLDYGNDQLSKWIYTYIYIKIIDNLS